MDFYIYCLVNEVQYGFSKHDLRVQLKTWHNYFNSAYNDYASYSPSDN